jgi:2-oxoglutarate ferredoxin oxidoreductase subunit beta
MGQGFQPAVFSLCDPASGHHLGPGQGGLGRNSLRETPDGPSRARAFFEYTEKSSKPLRALFIEDGKPLLFDNGRQGIHLDGFKPRVVDLSNGQWSADDCLVYDESSRELAGIIGRIFWQEGMPRPFGVFYREERPTYDGLLHSQVAAVIEKRGKGDMQALLSAGDTWVVE